MTMNSERYERLCIRLISVNLYTYISIGVGGISMSGLAEILLKEGFTVSGSDSKESALTDRLESLGAKVFYGQKASNIIPGIDVVVYTAAIHEDNEEYQAAVSKGLPMLSRARALGPADEKLRHAHRSLRYSRKDHDHIHAFPYPAGCRSGSHHLRGRHLKSHRRQYPGR